MNKQHIAKAAEVAEELISLEGVDGCGMCLECGGIANCEPDARGYFCDLCHKPAVYGVDEILIMGATLI